MGFTTALGPAAGQQDESTDQLNWRRARRAADRKVAARLMHKVDAPRGVRAELVERVRAEIAAGTYETDAKFDAAIDRLIDDL